MPKENRKEYLIAFCYALLVFFMVSEPFVFQVTNKEPIRMYGYLLFLIGAVILGIMLNKKGVENKNELSYNNQNDMQPTK